MTQVGWPIDRISSWLGKMPGTLEAHVCSNNRADLVDHVAVTE